mmetsp:Transcript_19765/g.25635  ORF Transcript_19765/g.25635 Transcript_19765/m.25635 type:complete len:217 (-) Transcript_19765:321-971(-)
MARLFAFLPFQSNQKCTCIRIEKIHAICFLLLIVVGRSQGSFVRVISVNNNRLKWPLVKNICGPNICGPNRISWMSAAISNEQSGGGDDDGGISVDELNNMDDYQPWISNDNLNNTITSQGGWFSSRSGIRGDGSSSSSSTSAFVSTALVIVGIAVAFVAGVLYGKKSKTEDGAVKRRNESFKAFLKNKLKRKEAHDDGAFRSRDRGESGIQFVSM